MTPFFYEINKTAIEIEGIEDSVFGVLFKISGFGHFKYSMLENPYGESVGFIAAQIGNIYEELDRYRLDKKHSNVNVPLLSHDSHYFVWCYGKYLEHEVAQDASYIDVYFYKRPMGITRLRVGE